MKLLLVQTSTATATLGTFTAGSKNITDRFTLILDKEITFMIFQELLEKVVNQLQLVDY